eukprot:11166663-Lingulodinium_polyedra.AAC.1
MVSWSMLLLRADVKILCCCHIVLGLGGMLPHRAGAAAILCWGCCLVAVLVLFACKHTCVVQACMCMHTCHTVKTHFGSSRGDADVDGDGGFDGGGVAFSFFSQEDEILTNAHASHCQGHWSSGTCF